VKITPSPKFWLTIALLLCIVSMLGANFVQTNGGTVTVKDLRWETPSGKYMSALLFVPSNATVKTPAAAIVASHGWYNNREMQDMNFVEYARRGYVVMSIDMYGHGNSDVLYTPEIAPTSVGFYDAVKLMASLPYVDKTKIGVTGHSNGAMAANFAIDLDNKAATPLIAAVLLVANNATYNDAANNNAYYNKYGGRDVGIVAAQFDEFFFRFKQADGTMSAPKDFINQAQAQSFLNYGIDPSKGGEKRAAFNMYKQTVSGQEAIRVIYTPYEIHPWNTVSTSVLVNSVDFFQNALGAPRPIPGTDQIWLWKEFFNVLGLAGFAMFVLAFAKVLLETSFFSTLKVGEVVVAQPAPTGKVKVWFWTSLVLSALMSGLSYLYLPLPTLVNAPGFRPTFFLQSPVFFIGIWAVVNGLFALILMAVTWFGFGGKSLSLKERGVAIGWAALGKTILLAIAVVSGAFAIVFIADFLFKVDFRLWVIPVKAFTPDKIGIILMYLPFFLIFYVLHSIAVNSFNFVKQGKEWVNVAVLALFTTLGAIVYVIIQYSTFFATGKSWTEVMTPAVSNIYGIWLFPILIYFPLAVILDRKLFKVTRNPYLGGLIFAMIMTIIACTNTLSQLP
jgi:dienelactone hydrolase